MPCRAGPRAPSRSRTYRDALCRSAVYVSRPAGPGPVPPRRSRSWSRTALQVPIAPCPALPVLPRSAPVPPIRPVPPARSRPPGQSARGARPEARRWRGGSNGKCRACPGSAGARGAWADPRRWQRSAEQARPVRRERAGAARAGGWGARCGGKGWGGGVALAPGRGKGRARPRGGCGAPGALARPSEGRGSRRPRWGRPGAKRVRRGRGAGRGRPVFPRGAGAVPAGFGRGPLWGAVEAVAGPDTSRSRRCLWRIRAVRKWPLGTE